MPRRFLTRGRPRGSGSRLAADGGGHTVVASDLAAQAGLELPALSEPDARAARRGPAADGDAQNPVDFAGGGEQDISSFAKVARALLESGEVDTVLFTGYFGGYAHYSDEFERNEVQSAEGMAEAAADTGVPLLAHTMYWRSPPAEMLRERGVPVFREVEAAVWAAGRLAHVTPQALRQVPELPPPGERIAGEPDYFASRELLASAGVEFAEARKAAGIEEVVAAAAEIGYPVVLKAIGELHKSDSGGVAVGLQGPEQLNEAFARMEAALSPPSYSVEAMAPLSQGLELIVGAKRDPRFGPILLVGAGGLYAEIVKDVAVALAPVTEAAAEALFRSLQIAPLLDGARGKPAVDVVAAARATAALSRFAAEHPEVGEVEINPLLALPAGALALDARIVLDADAR